MRETIAHKRFLPGGNLRAASILLSLHMLPMMRRAMRFFPEEKATRTILATEKTAEVKTLPGEAIDSGNTSGWTRAATQEL
jgi:hypothetical protein